MCGVDSRDSNASAVNSRAFTITLSGSWDGDRSGVEGETGRGGGQERTRFKSHVFLAKSFAAKHDASRRLTSLVSDCAPEGLGAKAAEHGAGRQQLVFVCEDRRERIVCA